MVEQGRGEFRFSTRLTDQNSGGSAAREALEAEREMSYDYRKQGSGTLKPPGPNMIGYETQPHQLYPSTRFERSGSGGGSGSASSHLYPQIAKPVGPTPTRPPPPVSHASPVSGADIRVAVKPGYRVAPAVQLLLPPTADVPRSLFSFDFELERKILVEVERERWEAGANGGPGSLQGPEEDPAVAKYVAMGLSREAVVMAVATFGDLQNKVLDFVSSYNLLREMGFPPIAVAGALSMYDNDRERALAHFV